MRSLGGDALQRRTRSQFLTHHVLKRFYRRLIFGRERPAIVDACVQVTLHAGDDFKIFRDDLRRPLGRLSVLFGLFGGDVSEEVPIDMFDAAGTERFDGRDRAAPIIEVEHQAGKAVKIEPAGEPAVAPGRMEVEEFLGLLEIEWAILGVQMGGSMQESTFRRRYSSSFRPYARR